MQEGTTSLLKSSGVDVDSISREAQVASKTVTDVSTKATPFLTKVTNFISSSSPETLGKIGLLLVAVYYLTPFALQTAVSGLRGYAGAQSLTGPPTDVQRLPFPQNGSAYLAQCAVGVCIISIALP